MNIVNRTKAELSITTQIERYDETVVKINRSIFCRCGIHYGLCRGHSVFLARWRRHGAINASCLAELLICSRRSAAHRPQLEAVYLSLRQKQRPSWSRLRLWGGIMTQTQPFSLLSSLPLVFFRPIFLSVRPDHSGEKSFSSKR